mgnify:CR=1 FL=1
MTEARKEEQKKNSSDYIVSTVGIFFFKVAGQPFTILSSLFVAGFLGPTEKGLAAITQLIPVFLSGMFDLGIGAALKYQVSRGDGRFKDIGVTSVILGFLQGSVIGLIYLVLSTMDFLGDYSEGIPFWIKISSAILIPLMIVRQILFMGFAGDDDFKTSNVLNFVASVLFALLSVFAVTVMDAGFEGVYMSFLIATLGTVFITLGRYWVKYTPQCKVDIGFIKFSYDYGLRAWIGAVVRRGNVSLDQLLLGMLAPASALGNYSVSVSLAKLLYLIPVSISPVLTNVVAKAKGEMSASKVALVQRVLTLLTFVLAIVISIGAWIVCPIVLPEFDQLPNLILVLLLGAVFYSAFHVLSSYFVGGGQPEKPGLCQIPALLASLACYPLLIPELGAMGAAIGSVVSYLLMYIAIAWMFAKDSKTPIVALWSYSKKDLKWIYETLLVFINRFKKKNS